MIDLTPKILILKCSKVPFIVHTPLVHPLVPNYFLRFADSPKNTLESSSDPRTLPTHIRAPYSPFNFRSLPSQE